MKKGRELGGGFAGVQGFFRGRVCLQWGNKGKRAVGMEIEESPVKSGLPLRTPAKKS